MRHTFSTMGTVASIELAGSASRHLERIEQIFREAEARFSLYDPRSELSRLARAEFALADASDELRDAYARALEWRAATGGAFTPHRGDGVIDLNGTIKAEAIAMAGAALDETGCRGWTINVGGDILARSDTDGQVSHVGIADPEDASALLCSIVMGEPRRAVATSGSAQRGDHIWRGGQRLPAEYRQVSVIANDILTADVLATAIVAGGRHTLDDLTDRWDIDVLTVDPGGELMTTHGFRAAMRYAGLSSL